MTCKYKSKERFRELLHRFIANGWVDGRGTGEWKRLSVNIPALVRTSIKLGKVYKFEKDSVSSICVAKTTGSNAYAV